VLSERGCTEITVPRRSWCDLTSEEDAVDLFDDVRPQVVLHLAAEVGGIGANMKTPGRFTYANLAMGVNVVEQSRRFEVEKVVVVGTVCSYPHSPPVPFVEAVLWNGYPEPTNAGYGIAKRAVYELLRQYHAQYGMPGAVVIPTNLYGPCDNFDPASSHVIPAMIRRFCGTDPVTLWGTGSASREFLHVDDAAEGIVRAAEIVTDPSPINLGGGGEVNMRDLAEIIATACQYTGDISWDASKPDGQPRRAVDARRAREILDWTPGVSLEDGIAETVSWWRDQCVPL
jgi:nucleoside-diphosphate-sugar epimerase